MPTLLPFLFICNLIFIEAFDPFVYNSKDPCSRHCYYDYHVPVCGSDDVTYFNQCVMKVYACWARVDIVVAYHGKCYPKEEEYTECEFRCHKLFSPVCGTDGKTYNNECLLNQERCYSGGQVNKQYDGFCLNKNSYTAACGNGISSKFQPVCGTDGVSYMNRDVLSKTACRNLDLSLRVQSFGECGQKRRARRRCRSVMKKEFLYEPVCGSDSRTHESTDILEYRKCLKKQTHLSVMYKGECKFKNKHPDHDKSGKTTNSREEPTVSPDSKQRTKKPPILPPPPTPPRPPPSFTRSSPTKINTNIGKETTTASNTNTLAVTPKAGRKQNRSKSDVTPDIDTDMKTMNNENGFVTNGKTEEITSQPVMTSFPSEEDATTAVDEHITELVTKSYATQSTLTKGSTTNLENEFVTNVKFEEMTLQPDMTSFPSEEDATTPVDEHITELVTKSYATQSTVTKDSTTNLENGFVTNVKFEEMTLQPDMTSFPSKGSQQATDATTSSDELVTNIVTNPYVTQSLQATDATTSLDELVTNIVTNPYVTQSLQATDATTSLDELITNIVTNPYVTQSLQATDATTSLDELVTNIVTNPYATQSTVTVVPTYLVPVSGESPTTDTIIVSESIDTQIVSEIVISDKTSTSDDEDQGIASRTKPPRIEDKSVPFGNWKPTPFPSPRLRNKNVEITEVSTEVVTEEVTVLTTETEPTPVGSDVKGQMSTASSVLPSKSVVESSVPQQTITTLITDKTNVKELHNVVVSKPTSIPVLSKTEGTGGGFQASTTTNLKDEDKFQTAVTYVIVTEPITTFEREVTSIHEKQ